MIKVAIVDDQAVVRTGLRSILEHDPSISIVGEADNGRDAVELVRRVRPDIVLMDIRMPGTDGLAATEEITADPELDAVKIVMLTTYQLDEFLFRALALGASGFLLKTIEPDDLRRAVHLVADGQALLDPAVTARVIERFGPRDPAPPSDPGRLAALTAREREVVELVAHGLTNDEIAKALYISTNTAKTHVNRAMSKLSVRDRAQLVVLAYRTGLTAPNPLTGAGQPLCDRNTTPAQ